MKAILIGRHSGEIPGVEVVEQRNIIWPATASEVKPMLAELFTAATDAGMALIFQNTPGQIAAALAHAFQQKAYDDALYNAELNSRPGDTIPKVGIVITKPGPRSAAARKVYPVPTGHTVMFREAIRFANPNAKSDDASYDEPDVYGNVGYTPGVYPVYVEVDPPMKFEFDHVEWF